MENGLCPKCGTASVVARSDGVKLSAMQGVAFVNTGRPTRATPALSFVCTNSGCFENYLLDPTKLAQTWQKVPLPPR